MRLNTREELLVRQIRLLDKEQQTDLIGLFVEAIHAQMKANMVATQLNPGKPLRVIGNARVEETLGFPKRRPMPLRKPPKKVVPKPSKKDDRDDLDPGMDDALG